MIQEIVAKLPQTGGDQGQEAKVLIACSKLREGERNYFILIQKIGKLMTLGAKTLPQTLSL